MSVQEKQAGRGPLRRRRGRGRLIGSLLGRSRSKSWIGRLRSDGADGPSGGCTSPDLAGLERSGGRRGGEASESPPQRRDAAQPVTAAESRVAYMDQTEPVRDRKLGPFAQVFSSCFACAHAAAERDVGGKDHPVQIFTRETRDSLELTAVVCRASEDDFAAERRQRSANGVFRFLTRFVLIPKFQPTVRPPDGNRCLRHGRSKQARKAKKPSPFYQERIGEVEDFVEEETIVLADAHKASLAGAAAAPPSVLLCAVTLEVKGGEGSPETHPCVSQRFRAAACGDATGTRRVQSGVLDHSGACNGPSSPNTEPPGRRGTPGSNTIHHRAAIENVDFMTNETQVMDDANGNRADDDDGGGDDEDDGWDGDDVPASERGNAELLQVASLVVQVAIQAALTQFKADAMSSVGPQDWTWTPGMREDP